MKHQRSVHSVARVIAIVALNLVMIASVGAQSQEREADCRRARRDHSSHRPPAQ